VCGCTDKHDFLLWHFITAETPAIIKRWKNCRKTTVLHYYSSSQYATLENVDFIQSLFIDSSLLNRICLIEAAVLSDFILRHRV